ncbi:MAG: SDR family oxidoreductase [Gemmatimonadaceae bacterium]
MKPGAISTQSPGNIFVTGATGVIGERAVPELVRRGFRVTAVGRSAEKRAQLESKGARAVALDMFDAESARAALRGHDTVINLATHIPPSTFEPCSAANGARTIEFDARARRRSSTPQSRRG